MPFSLSLSLSFHQFRQIVFFQLLWKQEVLDAVHLRVRQHLLWEVCDLTNVQYQVE